jgi:hypothetical protein
MSSRSSIEPCEHVRSKGRSDRSMVFNSLRMNLWVIRSRRENPSADTGRHPSREMGPKELSSTLSQASFPLVNCRLTALSSAQSPARYPGSTQGHRVSPTAHDLLSTGPVDNVLFRPPLAAYGFWR